MNSYVLLCIIIQLSTSGRTNAFDCPHDVDDNIHGVKVDDQCLTFMHIHLSKSENGLKQARKLCRDLFNGRVLPPFANVEKLKNLQKRLQEKSIIGRSFITDDCIESYDKDSKQFQVNNTCGGESISLSADQASIGESADQMQNVKASICLLYRVPKKGKDIYLEKAISCAQPSFDSVICESGTLKHCDKKKSDGTCDCGSHNNIYEGKFCQRDTLECNKVNPCHNGAECIKHESNRSYTCQCKTKKFSGEKCDHKEDPCKSTQCVHGKCVTIFPDLPYCKCDSGYTGRQCADKVDMCKKVYCAFNGSCVATANSFLCQCTEGHSGLYCQEAQKASANLNLPIITGSIGGAMVLFLCLVAAFVLTRRKKRHIRLRRASGMESTMGASVYGKPLWQSLMESTKMSTKASTAKAIKSGSSGSTGKGSPVKAAASPVPKQKPAPPAKEKKK